MTEHSRREFLKLLGAVAACGLTGLIGQSSAQTQDNSDTHAYKIHPWAGDDFTNGHRLRDGQLPAFPERSERSVDFVIVGGGMAGLAASHYLRNENILLLEQYSHTGGTSSGGTYNGIDYSMGAVCTGKNEGIYKELYDELKIVPAIVPPEQVAWQYHDAWRLGRTGSDQFYKELNRLTDVFRASSGHRGQAAQPTADTTRWNSTTFASVLSSFDPEFASLMDHICRSWFCGGAHDVSAAAGGFMARALAENSYVFDGGNSGVAKALKKSVDMAGSERCRLSAFVWCVEPKGAGASVVYSDADGSMHRVDCRHAIVATPPLVALRIVRHLPKPLADNFPKFQYGPIVVANFCMRKKVFANPYQSFAGASYPFSQMILAETPYMVQGTYQPAMGSVLTVYCPFKPGPVGRMALMTENREQLAEQLVTKLTHLVEGFQGVLEQVVLTRWGHAFTIPTPGSGEILKAITQQGTTWMTFAHSTGAGSQSLTGAIRAARYAADRCLAISRT